jgi:hypothetical protein
VICAGWANGTCSCGWERLSAVAGLVAAQGVGEKVGFGETSGKLGATADLSNAPRVSVDRPKPTFMLSQRHRRVHGLKPFQDLVDAAPEGSVLRPPPGNYAGPGGGQKNPSD